MTVREKIADLNKNPGLQIGLKPENVKAQHFLLQYLPTNKSYFRRYDPTWIKFVRFWTTFFQVSDMKSFLTVQNKCLILNSFPFFYVTSRSRGIPMWIWLIMARMPKIAYFEMIKLYFLVNSTFREYSHHKLWPFTY